MDFLFSSGLGAIQIKSMMAGDILCLCAGNAYGLVSSHILMLLLSTNHLFSTFLRKLLLDSKEKRNFVPVVCPETE